MLYYEIKTVNFVNKWNLDKVLTHVNINKILRNI